MTATCPWTTHTILGLPIAAATLEQAVTYAENAIHARKPLLVGVVNAAKIVNMARDERLNHAVRTADVIFADGMSVVWASRLLGRRLPERVTGIDLMHALFRRANERRYRVFLLGAEQAVLDTAISNLQRDYPALQIAGAQHGYYQSHEEAELAERIAASGADMLFVAMSSPKKEEFLARWAARMNVPVCHGVGGAFDVLAGKVRRAPRAWQRLGLEWLYRTIQEPRRLAWRYLTTNTRFTLMVLRERFARARRPAPEHARVDCL